MKNFHLPLSEETYGLLKYQAERARIPATVLARDVIDSWLRAEWRRQRDQAITAYAQEAAGTNLDLDPDLEAASIEHLIETR